MEKGVKVVAHNELRVSDGGKVVLKGGLLESARWVDIQAGGSLEGHGLIRAQFFTKGILSLSGKKPLVIDGNAYLSGELKKMEASELIDAFRSELSTFHQRH